MVGQARNGRICKRLGKKNGYNSTKLYTRGLRIASDRFSSYKIRILTLAMCCCLNKNANVTVHSTYAQQCLVHNRGSAKWEWRFVERNQPPCFSYVMQVGLFSGSNPRSLNSSLVCRLEHTLVWQWDTLPSLCGRSLWSALQIMK